MRIPEKLTVGAIEYDVKIVDHISDSGEGVTGRIDPHAQEILVKKAPCEQSMQQTFLHEFVHALHYHTGDNRDTCPPDERYVDAMACALLMVIKDNPSLLGPHVEYIETELHADNQLLYTDRSVIIDGVRYDEHIEG